jgi:LmbE family N-acetylglucosaminyl deacetylase
MNHKIIRTVLALLFVSLLITAPQAQQPAPIATPADRIALYQALLDLTNPWTVMCVAAHPDDEDGTSLIVMRRKYGAHTVSLFSTFGEGGQNAIGPELYEELGAIRARETMAAAEIQGSEPHFLGLKDFGYSKTRDEAFKFWGHEEALRRMVLEIRKLRPDVIITNHSTTSNDHGQHQATALMVVEAFDAAADPNKFPEQLKDGVTTWQVQRLFVRARGNQAQGDTAPVVIIDPNGRDPVRDVVYAEEALRALQKHATQGPWPKTFAEYATRFRAFSGQPGGVPGQLPPIRYRLVREAKGAAPLPANSRTFTVGLRLPSETEEALSMPAIDGKQLSDLREHREQLVSALLAKEKSVSELFSARRPPQDSLRLASFSTRLARAIQRAAGVSITIEAASALIPGETARFTLTISNNGNTTLKPALVQVNQTVPFRNEIILPCCSELPSDLAIPPGQSFVTPVKYSTPADAVATLPHDEHLYDEGALGRRATIALFARMDDMRFTLSTETRADVAPPVEIAGVEPSPFLITPTTSKNPRPLMVKLINHRNVPSAGNLLISTGKSDLLGGIKSQTAFALPGGEAREISVPMASILAPRLLGKDLKSSQDLFNLSIAQGTKQRGKQFAQGSLPLAYVDARVAPSLGVGYVRGFDFSLPNALTALGVESKELSVNDVKTADLSKFTSIVVDNRVYESQPELIAANQKLLDYANAGGTLIVFYHKSDEWNPDERRKRPQLAPYKLILGNERITDETAPISFLEPDHPLLNVPNKMGQDDFKDWIQERGLYYPREWDPQFHALLQSNDPGEAPLKGGLLVADYGRGHYIYTSMVWYRELRGGVPGAYRMLANMISYGRAGK